MLYKDDTGDEGRSAREAEAWWVAKVKGEQLDCMAGVGMVVEVSEYVACPQPVVFALSLGCLPIKLATYCQTAIAPGLKNTDDSMTELEVMEDAAPLLVRLCASTEGQAELLRRLGVRAEKEKELKQLPRVLKVGLHCHPRALRHLAATLLAPPANGWLLKVYVVLLVVLRRLRGCVRAIVGVLRYRRGG